MHKDKYSVRTKKTCNFKYLYPDFDFPENKVTSVWTLVFQDDWKIICVELDRWIDIPGWHLHVDESPIQALKRECFEEAFIEIKDEKLVKIVESDYFWTEKDDLTYMLFYTWKVVKIYDFVKNKETFARYELTWKELLEKYGWDKEFFKNIYLDYLN